MGKTESRTFVFKCRTIDGKTKYVTVRGRSISESMTAVKSRAEKFVTVEAVS